MRFYPRKVDANQKAIADALRRAGCSVQLLHTVGAGCPDLLVGRHGETFLLEVKMPDARGEYRADYAGKAKTGSHALTAARQAEWAKAWRGAPPIMVRTPEEALQALGLTKEKPKETGVERYYPPERSEF